ncbi:hypothetical protein Acife_1141 [Acidithiobacillus ferrivorans SS3]|uniref:Uncharacterized protein n=1 Tax=Acidithiobacillus ferrivorans SS3 TaxID=743299 RepID=G0JP75_9PROT|nr:hypothetical protein Acife_1141 [Acidithiobacillus ferrivorans SS3]
MLVRYEIMFNDWPVVIKKQLLTTKPAMKLDMILAVTLVIKAAKRIAGKADERSN